MKIKYLLLLASFFLVVLFCFLVQEIENDDHFMLAKREILMRKVGHELLLHSGDSTSRLLPVEKLSGEKYCLKFEKPFVFDPDILVGIVRKTFTANDETKDYIVNVLDCSRKAVVYGYSISAKKQGDVIPCSGRRQVSGCYLVTIEFGNVPFGMKKYAAAASLLAFIGLFPLAVIRNRKKPTPHKLQHPANQLIAIGEMLFDTRNKQLKVSGEIIKLTAKENRLLTIFAQNQNEVIDRTRLQKEIWEDDGVIVGRSLDVFISKLRKKLEGDSAVRLVNIHGKGYKLQIDSEKI